MSKYLYGASVQGIQEFIFKTNGLKEIVGASEIVEEISTIFTNEFEINCKVIQKAAGNIKIVFNTEKDVSEIVKRFPKKVMQYAYGITISQAVVKFENSLTKKTLDSLEEKLKIARNNSQIPLDSNINIIKLSPTSGRSTYIKNKDEFIDYATFIKREVKPTRLTKKITDDETKEFPKELSKISNSKNKIAIIHADGNGLGKLLQNLAKKLSSQEDKIEYVFSNFSISLDSATTQAAKIAYKKVGSPTKFRPIILGGDDLSVICSADEALDFTNYFLKAFEEQTKEKLKWLIDEFSLNEFENGLTACAGIAYTNEKYPFYYGVHLAEELCGFAKKESKKINKDLAPSSLMFHNVQSSFFNSYNDFVKNELTINENVSLQFGPYFVDKEHGSTIEDFSNFVKCLGVENSPKSRLRSWLSELHFDTTYAESILKRINQVLDTNAKTATNNALNRLHQDLKLENLFTEKNGKKTTPIHDAISLASILGDK